MAEQIPAHRRAVTLRSGETVTIEAALVETGAPAPAKKPTAAASRPASPAADAANT